MSARIRQSQAARVRDELSAAHGAQIAVGGEPLPGFPAPERLLAVEEVRAPGPGGGAGVLAVGEVRGLSEEKVRRLHGVAEVALTGALDRHRLVTVTHEEALSTLRAIKGIGPFWAEAPCCGRSGRPTP